MLKLLFAATLATVGFSYHTHIDSHVSQHELPEYSANYLVNHEAGPVDLESGLPTNGFHRCISDTQCGTYLRTLLGALFPPGTEDQKPAAVGDWWGLLHQFVEKKNWVQAMERNAEAVYGPNMEERYLRILQDKVNGLGNDLHDNNLAAFFAKCDTTKDMYLTSDEFERCTSGYTNVGDAISVITN